MRSTTTSTFRRDFDLYADPDHILRVLENLSRNAAQALMAKGAEDGRPKAIRFAAIRTDGLALIEISDTGPGFPRRSGRADLRAVPQVDEPGRRRPRPRDRGRPRDAKRRGDHARAGQGRRLLLRRAVPDQAADPRRRRAQGRPHPARGLSLGLQICSSRSQPHASLTPYGVPSAAAFKRRRRSDREGRARDGPRRGECACRS